MAISKFTQEILNKIIDEISKAENISKIEKNIVEPLIMYTFKRLYPYLVMSSIIFILTFLVALLILLLLIKQIKSKI
jgi:hypothetical protein|tara:strand:- start:7077 stop:7307 length:231 start_codon:yes stop_codon:yes gene_type:complete